MTKPITLLFMLMFISGCVVDNRGTTHKFLDLDVHRIPDSNGYTFQWKKELEGTLTPTLGVPESWDLSIEWNKTGRNQYEFENVEVIEKGIYNGRRRYEIFVHLYNHKKSMPAYFENSDFLYRDTIKTKGKARFYAVVRLKRTYSKFLF